MSLSEYQAFKDWIGSFDWDWFCTLTLRPGLKYKSAVRQFSAWCQSLEALAGREIYWIRVTERGRSLGALHFHVLVAESSSVSIVRAEQLWGRLAGDAQINVFDEGRGGVAYVLKSISDRPDYDFDAKLPYQSRNRMLRGNEPEPAN